MAWGTPIRNDFTDLSGVTVYDSHTALGSLTDTPSPGGALQSPRLPSNVVIVTDATATPDASGKQTAIRVYSRLAGAGEYKGGGYWGNGGFLLKQGQQLYGRYTFRVKAAYGQNTKGVVLLWPVKNGWAGAKAGSGDEEDVYEWYTFASVDPSSGGSNLHYKAADGTTKPSYQWQIPLGISDWSTWHTLVFTWTPTLLDLTIDGVRPAPVAGKHNYPVTNPLLIPQVPMFFAMQTAMLGQRDTAVTTRTTLHCDLDFVSIEPYIGGGTVTVSDPSNVLATTIDSVSSRVTWGASSASDGSAVHYTVEQEHPSGGGVWTLAGTPTTNSLLVRGLAAGGSYRWRVTASSAGGAVSSTVVSNSVTQPGSGTTVNAVLTATVGGGAPSGNSPLVVHMDPTGSSGTITAATFDPGDGSGPVALSLPLAAFDQTYSAVSGPNGWQATLTVSDVSSNTDTDTENVYVLAASNSAQTALLDMPYPAGPSTGGSPTPITAQQMRNWLDTIDAAAGGSVPANSVYQTGADIVEQVWLPGDAYPRMIRTVNDIFKGDGTFDPLTGTGLWALVTGSVSPPPPPSGTTTFAQPITWDASPSAGVNDRVATLPAGIANGSYALVGVMIRDNAATMSPPTGWTALDGVGNSNGNAYLRVFGKAVGASDSSTTVTFHNSSSVLQAAAGGVFAAATGVDAHQIAANLATAQNNHPTPSVTSANPSEMLVGFAGCRFSSLAGSTILAPSGSNSRASDSSTSSSLNDVALVMWDQGLRVTAGAGTAGTASTGTNGAFSAGWSGVLTHA